jgi:hypothetical protein
MIASDLDLYEYCNYLIPLFLAPVLLCGAAGIMWWKIGPAGLVPIAMILLYITVLVGLSRL